MQRRVPPDRCLGQSHRQAGFTMVELLIVVAIIGIMAAISIPNYMRFQCRSKVTEANTMLGSIYHMQLAYRAENDVFTDDIGKLGPDLAASGDSAYYNYKLTLVAAAAGVQGYTCVATGLKPGQGRFVVSHLGDGNAVNGRIITLTPACQP